MMLTWACVCKCLDTLHLLALQIKHSGYANVPFTSTCLFLVVDPPISVLYPSFLFLIFSYSLYAWIDIWRFFLLFCESAILPIVWGGILRASSSRWTASPGLDIRQWYEKQLFFFFFFLYWKIEKQLLILIYLHLPFILFPWLFL